MSSLTLGLVGMKQGDHVRRRNRDHLARPSDAICFED